MKKHALLKNWLLCIYILVIHVILTSAALSLSESNGESPPDNGNNRIKKSLSEIGSEINGNKEIQNNNLSEIITAQDGNRVRRDEPKKERFAIMTIHYEGTVKDDEYVLAIRVLMKSVLNSKTNADRIVIASKNVRQSTIDLFQKDGIQIKFVENIKNPYHKKGRKTSKYKSHFEFTLNKLFLWTYEEYTRVIYFDADNIVLNNLDPVFKCGHFCAVYMNPVYFHTGMLVVKPSNIVFNDMLAKLEAGLKSYDGADQGFLTEYFNAMDNALLFDPIKPRSEDKMNRMSIGYNMHHMYYYEKMNWDLYARGHFKHLAAQHPSQIPAYSIGYPILPPLKPWYWWSYCWFDNHWEFYRVRKELDESWFFPFAWRFLFMLVLGAATPFWFPRKFLINLEYVVYFLLLQFGDSLVALFFGATAYIISCYIGGVLVPALMPPYLGWVLFIVNNNGLMFIFLRVFCIICDSSNLYSTIFNAVPIAILQFFAFYISTAKIYSNPAPKVILLVFFIAVCFFYQIRPFRVITRKMTLRRKSSVSQRNPYLAAD